jgi:hypothetical protein
MAHIGCYVPAVHATIRATDKLFTRIAVDESVEENKSTFMSEMKETSYIIENLTPNSLVIIDELGRGKNSVVICEAAKHFPFVGRFSYGNFSDFCERRCFNRLCCSRTFLRDSGEIDIVVGERRDDGAPSR